MPGKVGWFPQGWRQHLPFVQRRPLLEAALLFMAVLALGSAVVWQARRAALDEARATATNLAALLHEQTTTAFRTTDLALLAARTRLERENLPEDDPGFRTYLRSLNEQLDYVRALFVIGADGFIIHDTDYPETPRVSLADRRYFQLLTDSATDRLFIGNPLLSRSVGRWFVPVARRFENRDGSFAGVVAAAVEPLFFERIFGRLDLGENDAIALFHTDSTLIARVPPRPDLYGRKLSELKLFTAELPQSNSGVYPIRNAWSGRMSIVGYAKLGEFPLIVTVVLDSDDALSDWRRQAWVVGLGGLSIIVLGVLLCVTLEKRRLEQQVAHQKTVLREKLEAIGYMTSSVAHDFRNLLAAILAGVRMLRKRGLEEKLLSSIEEAIDRGNRLTADLLQFAKDQEMDKRILDPNAQIERLVSLLQQAIPNGITLRLDLARDVRHVNISPALFDASLINLAMNSSHAMPEGGEIRISTRNEFSDWDLALPDGDYVVVRVDDTGAGIQSDKLDSVFEPFVTTKGSKGTGLGLFQVRRFATEAGGDTRIMSEVGIGTTVELWLPAVPSTEEPAPRATPKERVEGSG